MEKKSNNNNTEQIDIVDQEAIAIHFQEELLMDILSKLPVLSLLRFKCISKFWKRLISDAYFKMKHLNHAKNDRNSQKFLTSQHGNNDAIVSMYCCPLSPVQLVEDMQKLDCPSSSKPWHCAIHCCYNGLVILMVADNSDDRRFRLLLWNPSTKESILLPNPEYQKGVRFCLGFGYDSTSGEYKILQVLSDVDGQNLPSGILALKSDSWRKIDEHPRGIRNDISGMHSLEFIHEAFHWIGMFGSCSVVPRNYNVVSFSISNEAYGEILLPEQILCLKGNISIGVSILEGMLCVHSTCHWSKEETFKLWVMTDYGVKESWNALFTIVDPVIYKAAPIYRFADGEVLFWATDFQSKGHTFRTSKGPFGFWPRRCTFQHGIVFTESLISPKPLT